MIEGKDHWTSHGRDCLMLRWFLIPRAASPARLFKGKKRAIQELDNSLAEKTQAASRVGVQI